MNRTIIDNAQNATAAWGKLDKADQDKLKKYFHIRPTQSGITIISTLSFLPMRGVVLSPSELSAALNFLQKPNNYRKITQTNEDEARAFLTDKNNRFVFKARGDKKTREEDVQATMINTMGEDSNLSHALNRSNKIQFIASELRLQKGPYRVDIVGYDNEDLYLFELKRDRTTKMDQARKYVDHYQDPANRPFLEELLKNYPIHPVKKFNNIYGCMVMKYCEDKGQRDKLKDKAKSENVTLLFYNPSINYQPSILCK